MSGTEQSMISIRAEATRTNGLMRVQKMSLTKLVNKCLQLLDTFKKEQARESSPLVFQCASEVMTYHGRITDLLAGLEGNMTKYLELNVQTFTGGRRLTWTNRWKKTVHNLTNTSRLLMISKLTTLKLSGKFNWFCILHHH